MNGIWCICEESFWGVPAHNDAADPLPDRAHPVFDLFAGETAALLAWTHYLLRSELDALSPRLSGRIRWEVRQRVLDPFLTREDFWWMGLHGERVNNWNPWCVSNALAAGLLLEEEPARRAAVVEKAVRCLDRFLATTPRDGGCDEGPSYWNRAAGSLFDCLELLRAATDPPLDLYTEPLIGEMARFLYRVHVDGEWFVNGIEQRAGEAFRATAVRCCQTDREAALRLDLARAYPPEGGIVSWERTVRLGRAGARAATVKVVDDFRLARRSEVRLHLLLADAPVPVAAGLVIGQARGVPTLLACEPSLDVQVERLHLDDPRLGAVWGPHLWRLVLRSAEPMEAGRWRILLHPWAP